jgi:hypothetical protein
VQQAVSVTPVVNQKYKYILLYIAKAGCTSLRSLYLSVHSGDMSDEQRSSLDWYHNLNEVQPFDAAADYSDYYVYCITRNPYSRVVSAFLDQYVYARNAGVRAMMQDCPPSGLDPDNFIEFLEYLVTVPDEQRDIHFQTQSFFPYADSVITQPSSIRYKFTGKKPSNAFGVNYVGDIAKLDSHIRKVFKRIFKGDKAKHQFALNELDKIERKNVSFYGAQDFVSAGTLSVETLNKQVFAPKPQDFFSTPRAIELVKELYREDFRLFGYTQGDIPKKLATKEIALIPDDFDWKMYLRLNPDLPHAGIDNERAVVRHYLQFGRFEITPRAYKIEAPEGFDWQRYLTLNPDLKEQGISEQDAAIEHYISYGIRQERSIS